MDLENDTTQQTQRTFARANLLRTCYGETGLMDFGFYQAAFQDINPSSSTHSGTYSHLSRDNDIHWVAMIFYLDHFKNWYGDDHSLPISLNCFALPKTKKQL